jgi:hypothetical protein
MSEEEILFVTVGSIWVSGSSNDHFCGLSYTCSRDQTQQKAMGFMRDVSRHPIPSIFTRSDGQVDSDRSRERARRERIKAQRDALSAIARWLRDLLKDAPEGHDNARLG